MALGQADRLETEVKLAEQMGDPLQRRPATDREDALALDRRIDQRRQPEQTRQVRLLPRDPGQPVVRHQSKAHRRQRADAVIEPLEQKSVQIGKVARHMDFGDLALTFAQVLEAAEQARDQKRALRERLAGADDRAAGAEFGDFRDRIAEHLFLMIGDLVPQPQLGDQTGDEIIFGHGPLRPGQALRQPSAPALDGR